MATLTITVPDAQVPRVQAAVGRALGLVDGSELPRDATSDEVRQHIVDFLIETTRRIEAREAAQTAADAVTDIGATI